LSHSILDPANPQQTQQNLQGIELKYSTGNSMGANSLIIKTLILVVPGTGNDAGDWLRTLTNATTAAKKKKFFGEAVQDMMKSRGLEQGRGVPQFLELCCNFLEETSLTTEGLFRLSGSAVEIEKLKDVVDRGKNPDFEHRDPHVLL
jgi:hypothetical protein